MLLISICSPLENCISLNTPLKGELRWVSQDTKVSLHLSMSCSSCKLVAIGMINTSQEPVQFILLKIPTKSTEELHALPYVGYVENNSFIELSRSVNSTFELQTMREGNNFVINVSGPSKFSRGMIVLPEDNTEFNENMVIRKYITVLDTDLASKNHYCTAKQYEVRIRTLSLIISMFLICIAILAAFIVVLWKSSPAKKKYEVKISNSAIQSLSV
jgi:hypothetical protein